MNKSVNILYHFLPRICTLSGKNVISYHFCLKMESELFYHFFPLDMEEKGSEN